MLWIRGLIFTALVPVVVGFVLPRWFYDGRPMQSGVGQFGWVLIGAGMLLYVCCFLLFLAAGGTPTIFFTRHLRFLLGEEPAPVVSAGPYRHSRNPMYAGVLLAIAGQAILFASLSTAVYCACAALFFQVVIVRLEEPHLRATRGHAYDEYSRRVARWFGRRRVAAR